MDGNAAVIRDDTESLMWRARVFADLGGFCRTKWRGDMEFRDRILVYFGDHAMQPMKQLLQLSPLPPPARQTRRAARRDTRRSRAAICASTAGRWPARGAHGAALRPAPLQRFNDAAPAGGPVNGPSAVAAHRSAAAIAQAEAYLNADIAPHLRGASNGANRCSSPESTTSPPSPPTRRATAPSTTGALGMRLVKKTVNQDDVSAYHLFYADGLASPGTDITFFDWPVARERRGTHCDRPHRRCASPARRASTSGASASPARRRASARSPSATAA